MPKYGVDGISYPPKHSTICRKKVRRLQRKHWSPREKLPPVPGQISNNPRYCCSLSPVSSLIHQQFLVISRWNSLQQKVIRWYTRYIDLSSESNLQWLRKQRPNCKQHHPKGLCSNLGHELSPTKKTQNFCNKLSEPSILRLHSIPGYVDLYYILTYRSLRSKNNKDEKIN